MTTFQITTFIDTIQDQPTEVVNARDLHKELQSRQEFTNWIKNRISEYGFAETLDFIGVDKIIVTDAGFFGKREKVIKDYHITLDMAKELCMLERTKLGRQVRRHFIKAEKDARVVKQHFVTLLAQAQQLLLSSQPECKAIIRYREMGLTNSEISKLLDLSPRALEKRITKLLSLQLIEARAVTPTSTNTQLALL